MKQRGTSSSFIEVLACFRTKWSRRGRRRIMMVVVNVDSPEINRMWGGEDAGEVTIGAVMVSASGGAALQASLPDAKISFKMTKLRAEQWVQAMKFTKMTDWPQNDDDRKALHERLQNLHDPNVTYEGHWERYSIIKESFDQAEAFYEQSTADV